MTETEKRLLKQKADVFKALGHPTRLRIVEKLADGPCCVCEFVNETDFDFSTISAHLAVLQKVGVVTSEKKGREVHYSLTMPCVNSFAQCIETALKKQLSEHLAMFSEKLEENMEIKVFGPGCKKCKTTEDVIREAVKEAGLEATVTKVSEIQEIAAAGIMSTPAVAVDGNIRSTGKVPSKEEVKAWLGQ